MAEFSRTSESDSCRACNIQQEAGFRIKCEDYLKVLLPVAGQSLIVTDMTD